MVSQWPRPAQSFRTSLARTFAAPASTTSRRTIVPRPSARVGVVLEGRRRGSGFEHTRLLASGCIVVLNRGVIHCRAGGSYGAMGRRARSRNHAVCRIRIKFDLALLLRDCSRHRWPTIPSAASQAELVEGMSGTTSCVPPPGCGGQLCATWWAFRRSDPRFSRLRSSGVSLHICLNSSPRPQRDGALGGCARVSRGSKGSEARARSPTPWLPPDTDIPAAHRMARMRAKPSRCRPLLCAAPLGGAHPCCFPRRSDACHPDVDGGPAASKTRS